MMNRVVNKQKDIFIHSVAVVFTMTTVALSLPCPAFAQKLSDTLSVQPDSSEEEQRDTIASTPLAIPEGDSLKKARMFSDTALKAENPLTVKAQTDEDVEDTTSVLGNRGRLGPGVLSPLCPMGKRSSRFFIKTGRAGFGGS